MKTLLKKIYNIFLYGIRYPYYKLRKNKVHHTSQIGIFCYFNHCNIDRYSYIAKNVTLCYVDVGPYSCIARNVMCGGMEHTYTECSINPLINKKCKYGEKTIIGFDVWIGANCVIRQGVKIGDGCVIGAGSVVTKDIPENCIAYGSPAKIVKKRFNDEKWVLIKKTKYWLYSPNEAIKIINNIK